jgi:hypothetical protein
MLFDAMQAMKKLALNSEPVAMHPLHEKWDADTEEDRGSCCSLSLSLFVCCVYLYKQISFL